jgi:ABC-type uncharacterized transport system YnjBCD permease subunit
VTVSHNVYGSQGTYVDGLRKIGAAEHITARAINELLHHSVQTLREHAVQHLPALSLTHVTHTKAAIMQSYRELERMIMTPVTIRTTTQCTTNHTSFTLLEIALWYTDRPTNISSSTATRLVNVS